MKHRLLAVLLSLTLLLGLIPTGVAADGTYDTETPVLAETPAGETAEVQEPENDDPEAPKAGTAAAAYSAGASADVLYGSGVSGFDEAYPRELQDGETLRRGIDVSEWQGSIDWEAVADSGIEFAIIRVGYRGYGAAGSLGQDQYYVRNFTEARKYGIKVGAYIYSQATTTQEGVQEAQHAAKLLKAEGITLDLPLVIDYEFYDGPSGRLWDAQLSRQEYTDICNAFCAEAERLGYDSMVYANPSMLNYHLYREQLGRLWLAHYTPSTNYEGDYEYWQFSSNGIVPGISGTTDLNFWFDKGLPFVDVKQGDWFRSAVAWAYENGIMAGVSKDYFDPQGTAQRAMVVAVLYRALGTKTSASIPFTDVPAKSYYTAAVRWAYECGAVSGLSETEFGPFEPIKRQDLVAILYRLSGSPKSSLSLDKYSDVDQISGYARAAMRWAVEQGMISGYKDKENDTWTLRPQGSLTRAELCKIIMNYLTKVETAE